MSPFRKIGGRNYYDMYTKILLQAGQWPYQKPGERLFRMGVSLASILSILAAQTAKFFVCETTQCILQTIPMYMTAWIALAKQLTCDCNTRKMKKLMEHLHADWNYLQAQEEWEIMERYAQNGRRYTLIYTFNVYICAITFGSSALVPRILDVLSPLNESRPVLLPCEAYYFVDEEKYFYFLYFHLQFGALLCVPSFLAHDCTFLTYVEHICGVFAVVGFYLKSINSTCMTLVTTRSPKETHSEFRFEQFLYKHNITEKCLIKPLDDAYVKNIRFTICAHQRALRFCALFENTFSISLAVQLFIIVIGMSTSLMQISEEVKGDIMEVIRYFIFVVGQLLHLLIFSFEGQQLINHSLETHTKIYNGLWYKIPVKSQKLLLFAMRKSKELVFLSAGKIYIFSLESFTSIIQCSVSYFTVLSSTNGP